MGTTRNFLLKPLLTFLIEFIAGMLIMQSTYTASVDAACVLCVITIPAINTIKNVNSGFNKKFRVVSMCGSSLSLYS